MHRVIILNRGSIFASQWREFSQLLSSAHRLLQCYHRQKRDRRRCISRGIPPQPPATRVICQWASSLEWRVTSGCEIAHSGRKNLHQFLPILLWRHALSSSIRTLWFYAFGRLSKKAKIHSVFLYLVYSSIYIRYYSVKAR